jgi:hypothetical protein
MTHRLILLTSTLLSLVGLPALAAESKPAAAVTAPAKRTVLQFESTLKDEDNKAISGIFPMLFELRKPSSTKAFWKEKHWIAIDNGKYALALGRLTPLPKALDAKTAVLVVTIVGAGEVMHEPLSGEPTPDPTGGTIGTDGKRIVQYAEKSGFSYEAERAASADRIGQFTAKLLADTLDALDKRKVKIKVSKNHVNLTSVGGAGGTPFEMVCPPGTVVVGIRGGAGIYIDNFQVVCAPLE